MSSTYAQRRRRDVIVALAIAALVAGGGLVIYLTSAARAADLQLAADRDLPQVNTSIPTSLSLAWTQRTDPAVGAAVSPAGVVAVGSEHEVRGLDIASGQQRWSYTRSDRQLCALTSGDSDNRKYDPSDHRFLRKGFSDRTETDRLRGIVTGFRLDTSTDCPEIASFDPVTGGRVYSRTVAASGPGSLFVEGPYGGWLSPHLVQLWRYDLVRSILYGDQPAPAEPGGETLGCEFTDTYVGVSRFATVQHCSGQSTAHVSINYTDPHSKDKGWSAIVHPPIIDIDTGASSAVLVGLTEDRVAVLIDSPTPQVVAYDFAGTARTRTPAPVQSAAIRATEAAAGPSPRRITDTISITWVGGTLIGMTTRTVTETAPATTPPTTTGVTTAPLLGTTPSSTSAELSLTDQQTPVLAWTFTSTGLGAVVGSQILVPTSRGFAVIETTSGKIVRQISAPSADQARVDVSASSRGWFATVSATGRVQAYRATTT
ncbi:MAG: hypothetical protein WKF57_04155 [Nakamurella sp.]